MGETALSDAGVSRWWFQAQPEPQLMFARFTDRARRVLVQAQEEAHQRGHDYIGTEHLLLALLADECQCEALASLGVSVATLREAIEATFVAPPPPGVQRSAPFTPKAKVVLEYSLRTALQVGETWIVPRHILVGMMRVGDGVGALVLKANGDPYRTLQILSAAMCWPVSAPSST